MRYRILLSVYIAFTATMQVNAATNLSQKNGCWAIDTPGAPVLTDNVNAHHIMGAIAFSDAPRNPLHELSLLNFAVRQNGAYADIDWITLQEVNSNYFVVERSRDGAHYESVDTLKAAGNSSKPLKYCTHDQRPYIGYSFYRLKQIDFNGVTGYSKTFCARISDKDAPGVAVFPNPAVSSDISVTIPETETESVSVAISDVTGKVYYANTFTNDNCTVYHVEGVKELHTGEYYVQVSFNDVINTTKLMVAH